MSYDVLLHPDADEFLRGLDDKSKRIVRNNLKKLADNPYPGSGKGDKEKLVIDGDKRYRMHISREYTAFYDVYEDRARYASQKYYLSTKHTNGTATDRRSLPNPSSAFPESRDTSQSRPHPSG